MRREISRRTRLLKFYGYRSNQISRKSRFKEIAHSHMEPFLKTPEITRDIVPPREEKLPRKKSQRALLVQRFICAKNRASQSEGDQRGPGNVQNQYYGV